MIDNVSLTDLIAAERAGHNTLGPWCQCGAGCSTVQPTADHVEHLRDIVAAGKEMR